jgi:predicted O-methyltransferase YrrM
MKVSREALRLWILKLTDSVRASHLFPAESVDFCFIDADHSYASVQADLRAWWPKIRPGGVIAGHDYRQEASWLIGVTKAVHDYFGVRDAGHPAVPSCGTITKPLADRRTGRASERRPP